jgi:hypothetical protein
MTGQHVSKSAAFVAAILVLCAPPLPAQQINGRFSTAVYGWEQFDAAGASKSLVLGLQNIQVDVTQGGLTLSTSVYGNTEISEPFGSGGEFRVRNAFAAYRNGDRTFEMKLGRVPVFAGVGIGAVDGALFKVRAMESKLAVSAYGGSNVPGSLVYDHNRDIDKNFLLGAQVTGELAKGTRFGVSYVNRHIERPDYEAIRADSLYNPVTVMVSPGSRATQLIGADVSHASRGLFDVYGRYDYDLNLERTRRAELNARAGLVGDLTLLANFTYREPDVPYNSWFTFFPLSPIREYEGGLEYAFMPALRASARFAYVGYEGDLSRRLTAGVAAGNFSASYSGSNGYAGELSSFYAQGAHPVMDRLLTLTAGVSYSTYKLSSASPEETMFSGALGVIVRPDAPVTLELQGQLVDNKYLKNDTRGFLKISYWFNHNLGVL